jgi:guanosine-3',5'-bis(diphosphate) 3'-pyrophosphohydrolase
MMQKPSSMKVRYLHGQIASESVLLCIAAHGKNRETMQDSDSSAPKTGSSAIQKGKKRKAKSDASAEESASCVKKPRSESKQDSTPPCGAILRACVFATQKHEGQQRHDSNGTPYIFHPIQVYELLVEAGITDSDTLVAALLHDTVEDTKTSMDEIAKLFGDAVARIVGECSDDKSLAKEVRKQVQLDKAAKASLGAQLVKLADKYANVSDLLRRPPAAWPEQEIAGYAAWCLAVYRQLKGVNAFFDDKFQRLFEQFGFWGLGEEDLKLKVADYYKNIRSSE